MRKYRYKNGINIDTKRFNPTGRCSSGGLYFSDSKNISIFLGYGPNVSEVEIPDNANVYVETGKFKANKIKLVKIMHVFENKEFAEKHLTKAIKNLYESLNNEKKLINILTKNIRLAMYIPQDKITYKICLDVVKKHGYIIAYIPNKFRTKELCQIACKNWQYAIAYVPRHIKKFMKK